MGVKLTPRFIEDAKAPEPPKDRVIYWDATQPGFGLMVTAKGHRSFVVQYRAAGKSHRMSLKDGLSLADAKREARKHLGDVARGGDPLRARQKDERAAENTFRAIAEEYVKREGRALRSMPEREAILKRHVFPKFGARPIDDIKRSELTRHFDKIEDECGPSAADHALAVVRRVMSWHAARSDDFRLPVVRGMTRTKPKDLARQRVLSDDEIRAVWAAADLSNGVFGPFVQFLLLTAARRTEVSHMRRAELAKAVWTIPETRYKTGLELVLPLSEAAQRVLVRLPVIGNGSFVFTTDGEHAFSGYSKAKRAFDKACGVRDWTLHDLRRTARSLMSRAGVSADVAERCLGHVIAGVRGTYDRHAYFDEKRQAFEALAALVDRILKPANNVVELVQARVL